MGSCCANVGKCLGSVLRVILFILCTLLFMGAVVDLIMKIFIYNYLAEVSPKLAPGLFFYIHSIFLISLAFSGCYGAYSGSAKHLKWFALILVTIAAVKLATSSILIIYSDTNELKETISKPMVKAAAQYQMSVKDNEEKNKNTQLWDLVQTNLDCCGLESPDDWHKWRKDIKSDQYPISCCARSPEIFDPQNPAKGICRTPNNQKHGCMDSLLAIVMLKIVSLIIDFLFYLLLAIIAIIVAKHVEPDTSVLPFQPQKFYDSY